MKIRFKPGEIDAAIQQLEDYGNSLVQKSEQIRRRTAKILRQMVEEGFNGAGYDDVIHEGMKVPDVSVTVDENENVSLVIAHGKEAVFVEFGAGVYYNSGGSVHPSRPPGIVSIGEYGHGYGKRQIWGYYDENGNLHLTHGTPASAPMFYAAKEIARLIPDIAREVFKGGVST